MDTKAWEFMEELSLLEDWDAIEDGADLEGIYEKNSLFSKEVMKRVKIDWDAMPDILPSRDGRNADGGE